MDLQTRHPEMRSPVAVLALPDGGALVAAYIESRRSIVRLDQYGAVSYIFKYKPSRQVTDFILTLDEVLILQLNGVITRVKMSNGSEVKSYRVDVQWQWQWRGISVDGDNLLIIDHGKGEVFSFKLSEQKKEVKVRDIKFVRCITSIPGSEKMYAVCADSKLLIYDSSWKLQRSIQDWFVQAPASVFVLPNNNILMGDMNYQRVSVLSSDWTWISHVVKQENGIGKLQKVSFRHPDLWIVYTHKVEDKLSWHLKRFQIFKT